MAQSTPRPFTALVLAADRTRNDPVAAAAGVPCKALAPVGGRPMLLRVLDALRESREVDGCVLCGPPADILDREPLLRERVAGGELRWVAPQATPSTSALAGFDVVPAQTPVLLTTADHALLTAPIVDHFCRDARGTGCDVVAALALHARTVAAFPGMRRTKTRFKDGPYCGCNLFAFLTPPSRRAAALWRRVEDQRKKPIKMLGELGWGVVLRYLLGRLTLADALREISRRMQLRAGAVVLPYPEAAVDVDSVEDWRFARAIAGDDR
jgi:CTP:molybdopterin cytidylyltransferase MocA